MCGAHGEEVLLWLGEQLADSCLLNLALDVSPPFLSLHVGNLPWKKHSVEAFALGKHWEK